MGTLEEKKAQLGISRMEFDEQRELYKDFVNVGGKIVQIAPDPNNKLNQKLEKWLETKETDKDRERALEQKLLQDEREHRSALTEKERLKNSIYTKKDEQKSPADPLGKNLFDFLSQPKKPHPAQEYFSRLAAKWVCIIYGIFNFWGNKFKRSFLDLNIYEFQNGLIDSKQILVSILYQEKEFSKELRKMLKEAGLPYYYELLERFDSIYDENIFIFIKELRKSDDPIKSGKETFLKLFKKILILNRFHPSLYNAFEKALTYEKIVRNFNDLIVNSNLKKLNKFYRFLFYNYFPKLLNLIDFYHKDEIANVRKTSFKDFIRFTEQDSLGYLTKMREEEDEKEKQKRTQEEKEKKLLEESRENAENGPQQMSEEAIEEDLFSLPEPIQNGLRVFRKNVNFKEILDFYTEIKDPRVSLTIKDKVFITLTLLEFFDKEFSFVFISSGVQFNIFSDRGQRWDYRSNLKDLYFYIDNIYKSLNEYARIVSELRRVNTNTYLQIREQFVKVQQLNQQRTQISLNIRNQTSLLIDKFAKQFKIIVEDYENQKRIIQNPEEILNFDTRVGGKKFSHNQKVIEIFMNAYYVSSALYFLTRDGELGGSNVLLERPLYLKIDMPSDEEEDFIETEEPY
jgi:hypothetical protein